MKKELLAVAMLLFAGGNLLAQPHVNDGTSYLMNQPLDMSTDFRDLSNTLFFADHLESFDAKSGEGLVNWKRGHLMPRQAFNTNGAQPRKMRMLDFPFTAYENDPNLKFKIDFVTPRTVRIRMLTTPVEPKPAASIMLAKEPGRDGSWKVTETNDKIIYSSDYGTIQINKNPWRIVLKDKAGRILSQTAALSDADSTQVKYTPFCFVKRGSDNARRINPVFTLTADEMIFGCGESATGLNKAGQKVNLFVTDPQGPETDQMYKPIPFFMSNRGYGMFMHTSAPVTCDFGATYIGLNKMFMGDENLDLFVFFGEPKDILDEYTDLVGKPGMPPLWSFGTWMSRITYLSEKEGYDVAANIRKNKYPCDVIHFDTGWFDVDLEELWRYRDLIVMFVKRNFTVMYKQTILGPLWIILNPLITTVLFNVVFGGIAGLSTDGTPSFLFYMAGNTVWTFFASCINGTANTFVANSQVFGKVYFPRLTTPISQVLTSLINFFIQFVMYILFWVYFAVTGSGVHLTAWAFAVPLVVLEVMLLGLGVGIIVSALTTKYRDLAIAVSFGVQLWMYISPVVYPLSSLEESPRLQMLMRLNPMTAPIEVFRMGTLGTGTVEVGSLIYSLIVTAAALVLGVVLFSRIEKTFMDTV